MAGSKGDYLENKILDHVLGGADYTRPATVYCKLFTAAPDDTGGGTQVSTANWTNYAAVAITNNDTNFPAATGGVKSNGAAINFGTATIPSGTVTVTSWSLEDASNNLLYWGELSTPRTIANGDTVSFAIGDLTIIED